MLEPNIDPKEIDTVISYLDKDKIMLEYGCGGSTTIFPKYVKKFYSIEHNLDLLNLVLLASLLRLVANQ